MVTLVLQAADVCYVNQVTSTCNFTAVKTVKKTDEHAINERNQQETLKMIQIKMSHQYNYQTEA